MSGERKLKTEELTAVGVMTDEVTKLPLLVSR